MKSGDNAESSEFLGQIRNVGVDLGGLISAAGFEPGRKLNEDPFGDELRRYTQRFEEARAEQAEQLARSLLPVFDAALTANGPMQDLLERAKLEIREGRCAQALDTLKQVIAQIPESSEARYLIALCRFRIGEMDEAMAELNRLRDRRIAPALDEQVTALRMELREATRISVTLEAILLGLAGEPNAAARASSVVERLRRVADLDPEVPLYPYLLGGCLLRAGVLPEALAAVRRSVAIAQGEELEASRLLEQQIRTALLRDELNAARSHYLAGKYGLAQVLVRKLRAEYGDLPLHRTFDGYLTRIQQAKSRLPWRKSPNRPEPPGTPQETDGLHFFLVGDQMRDGAEYLKSRAAARALKVLEPAVSACPHFRYAQYLLGCALYGELTERAQAGEAPSLEEALAVLERAHRAATSGSGDPDITEVAKKLDVVITDNLKRLEKIRRDRVLLEEWNARLRAIDELGHVIRSLEQYHMRVQLLKDLTSELRKGRDLVATPEAKGVVEQLQAAVANRLSQLARIFPSY